MNISPVRPSLQNLDTNQSPQKKHLQDYLRSSFSSLEQVFTGYPRENCYQASISQEEVPRPFPDLMENPVDAKLEDLYRGLNQKLRKCESLEGLVFWLKSYGERMEKVPINSTHMPRLSLQKEMDELHRHIKTITPKQIKFGEQEQEFANDLIRIVSCYYPAVFLSDLAGDKRFFFLDPPTFLHHTYISFF